MAHLSEGALREYLDGEMAEAERDSFQAHLDSCPACRSEAEAQERASTQVAGALSLLDRETSLAPEEARRKLYARWNERAQGQGMLPGPRRGAGGTRDRLRRPVSVWGRTVPLPWAASVALLLTAGAASALPGSPVRDWLAQGWNAVTGTGSRTTEPQRVAPSVEEATGAPEPAVLEETGASIRAEEEGVELWIRGLPAGADLRVVWVEGDMAGIFAGEGTRFRTEAGRVEAEAPPGAVRVEIPRSLASVVLGVDGTVVLRVSGGEVDTFGPVQRRTPMEILFRPGGS